MAKDIRVSTKYAGVYYVEKNMPGSNKTEKVYYIRYRKDGKMVEEQAGRQNKDDMTPARAAGERADRMSGKKPTNAERRAAKKAERNSEAEKWTIGRLYSAYIESRTDGKSKDIDTARYQKHLAAAFANKEPKNLSVLDIQKFKNYLGKQKNRAGNNLSPQTIKHVLNLLTWIINFGVKSGLCQGLSFKIKKPSVNNEVTEDLTNEQLQALLSAIDASTNTQVSNLMKVALYTGMRRGELLNLQWLEIDFDRGFIHIRAPKGGIDQKIPLNSTARQVLESHLRTESTYVFPGKDGGKRVSVQAAVNKIKKKAGLPANFRPLHGLRHAFASMMVSSGKVDLYTLQRLLTHKDSRMTQRYSHLRDEALKKASELAGELIDGAIEKSNIAGGGDTPNDNIIAINGMREGE